MDKFKLFFYYNAKGSKCHVPFHLEIEFKDNNIDWWMNGNEKYIKLINYKYKLENDGKKFEVGPLDGGNFTYAWPHDFHLNISIVPCHTPELPAADYGANILVTFQLGDTLVSFETTPLKNWRNNYLLVSVI